MKLSLVRLSLVSKVAWAGLPLAILISSGCATGRGGCSGGSCPAPSLSGSGYSPNSNYASGSNGASPTYAPAPAGVGSPQPYGSSGSNGFGGGSGTR